MLLQQATTSPHSSGRIAGIGPHGFDAAVTVVHGDLRSRGEWSDVLGRIDVVVHAAAAAGGSRSQQLANTVVATERLLDALGETRPTRFVHVSSLSVYDFHALRSCLDEDARARAAPTASVTPTPRPSSSRSGSSGRGAKRVAFRA